MESIKSRFVLIILLTVSAVYAFLPNLMDTSKHSYLPQKKINYGLDIQGGLHLVMGVDIDGVLREATGRLATTLSDFLQKEGKPVASVDSKYDATKDKGARYTLEVNLKQAGDKEAVTKLLQTSYPNLQVLDQTETQMTYIYTTLYLADLSTRTLDQAIETIRNRIDEFGVAEPSITAQGSDRILVQLPGIEDATKAKDLINRTAKLEFMMVENPSMDLNALVDETEKAGNFSLKTLSYSNYVRQLNDSIQAKIPKGTMVLFGKSQSAENLEVAKTPYLVRTDTNLGGDSLKDAFVSYDQYNTPIVSLSFNPAGAARFGDLTGDNIGKQMAIVLDQTVYSAPVIQSRIAGGSAQITMGGSRDLQKTIDEAKSIAVALRAGALPARLEQLEERTIGPSLGADSIAAGKKASLVAALLIVAFMIVYYKTCGVIAVLALALNMFFTLCLLSLLGATLTLPGIAGMALTLGTAIDANVIIFERIKEELAKGASFRKAISDGFQHAFSSIFDSNITTAITCFVLIYYGSGPVRGFAVTLLIGLTTSMFTAIFVSRAVMDLLTVKFGLKKLSI
ncbi:MAG: protein translocase subunit SecD [Bdellovibrionales bacterium]|nr:protein translocase subunit SecD [Bdellovibrionales bacterium]